jgi:hypothetical protein
MQKRTVGFGLLKRSDLKTPKRMRQQKRVGDMPNSALRIHGDIERNLKSYGKINQICEENTLEERAKADLKKEQEMAREIVKLKIPIENLEQQRLLEGLRYEDIVRRMHILELSDLGLFPLFETYVRLHAHYTLKMKNVQRMSLEQILNQLEPKERRKLELFRESKNPKDWEEPLKEFYEEIEVEE